MITQSFHLSSALRPRRPPPLVVDVIVCRSCHAARTIGQYRALKFDAVFLAERVERRVCGCGARIAFHYEEAT